MTAYQFEQKLRKPERIEDTLNYLICISFIVFGFWLAYGIATNDFHLMSLDRDKSLTLLLSFFSVVLGVYGFRKISKQYRVGCIHSLKTIDEKRAVVDEYLSHLKLQSRTENDSQIECIYTNKYLNSLVIRIHIDDSKVLYNVQTLDIGSKGIIDYGLSSRATKRLRKFLTNRL